MRTVAGVEYSGTLTVEGPYTKLYGGRIAV